jgi:hypothetical protein
MKKILLALCVLCAPAFAEPATSAAPGATEHARVELAPSGHAFKQLQIDNPLGDVKVEGYDGTAILIETHKHAPDEETLERLRVSLVPNPDGTVHITTTADKNLEAKPVAASAVRIDLVIRAPRDARVDASVAGGKLELVNMDAGGELDSASGPLSVRNVQGEVVTHSVSGPMTLAQVFGSVDAATVSSDVDLDTIGGERLIASANHGHIAGRRVRARDVELTTTDGKIMLEAEAALRGHLVVSSLRGDVEVHLHRHGAVFLRARGTKVDFGQQQTVHPQPNGWSETTIGQGEHPALVELRSTYGMVQFTVVE